MKGGDTIFRTILITEAIHKTTGIRKTFNGRYDPVTLQRQNYKVLRSYQKKFRMTDEEFATHGHEMEEKK